MTGEAVNVALVIAQVRSADLTNSAAGGEVLLLTLTEAVAVQLVSVLVTVTVYVPVLLTVAVLLLPTGVAPALQE